ncbi:MAG: hypothetical protein ACRENI_13145 [Gemmatimonadaceae bacterium]
MRPYTDHGARRAGSFGRIAALGGALALGLTACSDLLEVEDFEIVEEEILNDPGALGTIVAGALGDFQVGYSGGGLDDKFLSVTALITDEFHQADTFGTRRVTDKRDQFSTEQGNTSDAAYFSLHRARRSLNLAAGSIQEFDAGDTETFAQLKALEGFTYVALAEGFCSGIPFSEAPPGSNVTELEGGVPISTSEAFAAAVGIFDEALAADDESDLAAVGKGRALLNNGDFAGAAAAVANVPTDFVYLIEHSDNTDRQENAIFNLNSSNERYTVSDREGTNGLPFRSALDPRVPWSRSPSNDVGFDRETPLYNDLRYPDVGTDVPLASGIEARLIEAEAALDAGDAPEWLDILNELREDVRLLMEINFEDYNSIFSNAFVEANFGNASLAPLADPGTENTRVDLMFKERAFWLYTTGHRLGDLRRLIRQYGRSQDKVFPVGPFHKGGDYGDDVNFPIPFEEQNNENFDASQCDVNKA